MKVLLASILMVAAMNASAFNGSFGKSTALDYAGAVIPGSVEKQFLNVKNGYTATIAAGSGVVLDLTADDGASVVISSAGYAPLCIVVASCAVGKLCKCQNYGVYDSALFDVTSTSAVAGKRIYLSTSNAGYFAARTVDLVSEVAGGIFYDAASASGTVQVFINTK